MWKRGKMRRSRRKLGLITQYMPASVQVVRLDIKTQIPLRNRRITQENNFSSPMLQFVFSVWSNVRVASTTKHSKGSDIWM